MSATDASSQQAFSLKSRKMVVDTIDDDALLTEEDKAPKTAKVAADCTTRRRACKNCVCGRAEEERRAEAAGVVLVDNDDDDGPPAGGCGNCSKGDAFRCAGCPYNGTSAWNNDADGKVKLNLMDDN
jgi:hypothetical protein